MGLIAYCPLFNIIVRPSSQRIQRNIRNVGNEIQLRPIEIAHSRCTHWLHGSGKAFLRPAQGLVTRIGSEDIPTLLFRVVNRADVADLRARAGAVRSPRRGRSVPRRGTISYLYARCAPITSLRRAAGTRPRSRNATVDSSATAARWGVGDASYCSGGASCISDPLGTKGTRVGDPGGSGQLLLPRHPLRSDPSGCGLRSLPSGIDVRGFFKTKDC